MSKYIVHTESGHQWLIEDAESSTDALAQYYDGGDAEPHTSVTAGCDDGRAEYLRDQGQSS